ncbi:MAG TPA: glucosyl-3-phosphoglycerate synthase [Ilumatobacteraceae bacterium]|nr:glucosyl-3-phosphoglycerate synthase [Ilumatobacteraceae bacterium]
MSPSTLNTVSPIRTYDASAATVADALAAKGSRTVSVCIPCKNEAGTIGTLVEMLRSQLVDRHGLVDELIVLDDNSTDDTAAIANRHGARVVPIATINDRYGPGTGKGNALWATVLASSGDFIVWCDGDVTTVEPSWFVGLLMPLLTTDDIALVKATYHRPTEHGGGGRTTELVARPLISLFMPELSGLHQPLSGEFAGRRTAIEEIPFVQGWGVEIAMLADIAERFGPASIAQVDVGDRLHRHQGLDTLGVQAAEVMATLLSRVGADKFFAREQLALLRPNGAAEPLNLDERPPIRVLR